MSEFTNRDRQRMRRIDDKLTLLLKHFGISTEYQGEVKEPDDTPGFTPADRTRLARVETRTVLIGLHVGAPITSQEKSARDERK